MKNKKIAEVFERIDSGTITLEEANKVLKEEGAPYRLDPWKNHIGRSEDGAGLMDTGTGTLDKVKVIEDEAGIRLAEPAFDAENFKKCAGGSFPAVMVQYGEVWYHVADDGVTLKAGE